MPRDRLAVGAAHLERGRRAGVVDRQHGDARAGAPVGAPFDVHEVLGVNGVDGLGKRETIVLADGVGQVFGLRRAGREGGGDREYGGGCGPRRTGGGSLWLHAVYLLSFWFCDPARVSAFTENRLPELTGVETCLTSRPSAEHQPVPYLKCTTGNPPTAWTSAIRRKPYCTKTRHVNSPAHLPAHLITGIRSIRPTRSTVEWASSRADAEASA